VAWSFPNLNPEMEIQADMVVYLSAGLISIVILMSYLFPKSKIIQLKVEFPTQVQEGWIGREIQDPSPQVKNDKTIIQCYDPATGYHLGTAKVITREQVFEIVEKARIAQKQYQETTFKQRRALLSSLLQWVIEHQSEICKVAARDSGKTFVDAGLGEILTTCEKLRWTIEHGENVLSPQYRKPGLIMSTKIPMVEYVPVGVMGCIVRSLIAKLAGITHSTMSLVLS
jgi:delta 1-pyrroline-5-carboxylate dehydrogenase